MALNKLKKWIGTQLFASFLEEYNQNVDATNAAIDLAETNAANISLLLKTTTFTITPDGGGTVNLSSRITGKVLQVCVLSRGRVMTTNFWESSAGVQFVTLFDITTGSAFNEEVTLKVHYI